MTLATLLEELKEVDAEEWEEILDWFGGLKRGLHGESISPHHDLGQALIQNSIQRACERREWGFIICNQVANVCTKTSTYASEIYDTPAEALLAAYIAAVRASQ